MKHRLRRRSAWTVILLSAAVLLPGLVRAEDPALVDLRAGIEDDAAELGARDGSGEDELRRSLQARIEQTGSLSMASIVQSGRANQALIEQAAAGSSASIFQSGFGNQASIVQR